MATNFGVEIELGVIGAGLKKPISRDFSRAFRAYKEYKAEKMAEHKKFFGKPTRQDESALGGIKIIEASAQEEKKQIEKEYLRLPLLDEKALFREIFLLHKRMQKNIFFSRPLAFFGNLARGIAEPKSVFSEYKKITAQKVLLEMAFFKILVLGAELGREFPGLKYDESDALEFTSRPSESFLEIEAELLKKIWPVEKKLRGKKLRLLFGGSYPRTKRMGLAKAIGLGEDQNFLGLHVHVGGFGSVQEMVKYYNKAVDFLKKRPSLIEKERRELYLIKTPPKLNPHSPLLGFYIRKLFSNNAKLERSARPNVEAILAALGGRKKKGPLRDYSAVFIRPELGTVEIRAFGTKGALGKTVRENLHENFLFLERFFEEMEKR